MKIFKTLLILILIAIIIWFGFVILFKKSQNGFKLNTTPILKYTEEIKTGAHGYMNDVNEFEQRMENSVDIVAIHLHWGNNNLLPDEVMAEAVNEQKTVLVFWNPMNYLKDNNNQEEFFYKNILSGKWDKYIDEFIENIQEYDCEIILAPFEEINGEWVPWSGYTQVYGNISSYRQAFRYLREKFQNQPNVSFAWVVNYLSVPDVLDNQIEKYYPGSDYVDIIGINGFNFDNPWVSFDEIFKPVIRRLQKYYKPIYITSFACAQGDKKSAWIKDFFNSEIIQDKWVWGWVWFNENKERDWRVWSDPESEEIFKQGMFSM